MADSGKFLNELKVSELKDELCKRGLEKSGIKSALVTRLREALIKEGSDPDIVVFTGNGNILDESIDDEDNKDDMDFIQQRSDEKSCAESLESRSPESYPPSLSGRDDLMPPPLKTGTLTVDDIIRMKANNKSTDSASLIVHVGNTDDIDFDLKSETKNDDAKSVVSTSDKSISRDHNTCDTSTNKSKEQKSMEDVSLKTSEDSSESEGNKNLWVTNLTKGTKAADLKQLFSKHGKVVSAKIVMHAKSGNTCFGFLQMSSVEQADTCLQLLDKSELNGAVLCIKRAKGEPQTNKKVSSLVDDKEDKDLPKPDTRKPYESKEKELDNETVDSFKKRDVAQSRSYRTGKGDDVEEKGIYYRQNRVRFPRGGFRVRGSFRSRPYGSSQYRYGGTGYRYASRIEEHTVSKTYYDPNRPKEYIPRGRGRGSGVPYYQKPLNVQAEDLEKWRNRQKEIADTQKREFENIRRQKAQLREERIRLEIEKRDYDDIQPRSVKRLPSSSPPRAKYAREYEDQTTVYTSRKPYYEQSKFTGNTRSSLRGAYSRGHSRYPQSSSYIRHKPSLHFDQRESYSKESFVDDRRPYEKDYVIYKKHGPERYQDERSYQKERERYEHFPAGKVRRDEPRFDAYSFRPY